MSPGDEPLLHSEEVQHALQQQHSRVGSFSCLCSNASFSPKTDDSTPDNLFDVKQEEIVPLEDAKELEALESPIYQAGNRLSDSVGFSFLDNKSPQYPTRNKKCMVSWASMEQQTHPTTFEISGASSCAHDKLNKPQGLRKSGQLDDNAFPDQSARLIYIGDPRKTCDKYEFPSNEIRTSKYTFITFLPKNLFIQFHRVAYLYFLAIAALNQLPPLAVFGRTVSLFPLLFVLFVTAVKDGYEDWRRHRSDKKENNREALVFQSGCFQPKKWKKVQAGEVVKLSADESIPCDIVLLGTSDPSGIAYILTMNLDGESNLKTRYARQETASAVAGGDISGLIRCEQPNLIRCEQPNRNIYEFNANMEFEGHKFSLTQSNIILRGCQLKNTEWVIGVVVYTGFETKAMLNSAPSPAKRSKLESYMNRETLWLSVFLFIMCSVVAVGMGTWLDNHNDQLDTLPYYRKVYFTNGRNNRKKYKYYGIPMEIFFSFLSSVIVFQIMIPISLYITMELVRLGQSYFMIGDGHMYDSGSNSRFQCRSLNINEDLGQIRYIFSDKTGTLTQNKMEFRMASIYGKNYGASIAADSMCDESITGGPGAAAILGKRWKLKSEIGIDFELMNLLHKDISKDEQIAAHEFFLTLAACNTVIPMPTQSVPNGCGGNKNIEAIDYQGESPDEQALVAAASAYGYTLFERTSGHIVIDKNGEKLRLDVLGLHEFDSIRKRMSVVIRFPDNSVKVLVKGADSSMLNILARGSERDDYVRMATQSHLTEYSSFGLRTLVVAARDLTDLELEEWQRRYEDASTSLTERSAKLRQTAALVECNLKLLGATGIEDKLQDGVPEAIESLRQAGIKVWVLTGDKQETAISIGLSCKLLTLDMQRIIINGTSEAECRHLLSEAKAKYCVRSAGFEDESLKWKKDDATDCLEISSDPNTRKDDGGSVDLLALIIDGNSLVYILEKELESELYDLAICCKVVLCCRVAPLQKAGIVDLIKSRTADMTLAVGDGANDVSMIQTADVGVGICGQEGRQAVMASDFAMGQFRFLKRLLLVHGHWNYQRIGYLVLYNFYRNAVFVLMLFWYILYTAFSTTSALTDWSSVLYSVIYTSVPTVIVGVMDKDLSHRTLLRYPKLYGAGHRQESYNMKLFWITMLDTLWQSLALFFIPFLAYWETTIDIWSLGSLWTIAVVILVNIHLAMDIQRWVSLTHAVLWGSIIVTYGCMVVLDSIPTFPNYWTFFHLACSPKYWITIVLVIIVALLPRFFCKVVYQMFWPSDIQIAREAEILRKRSRLEPKDQNLS